MKPINNTMIKTIENALEKEGYGIFDWELTHTINKAQDAKTLTLKIMEK